MEKEDPIPSDHFKCENCGGIFKRGWSEEEAINEQIKNFSIPPADDDALLCDKCYTEFMAWFKTRKQ